MIKTLLKIALILSLLGRVSTTDIQPFGIQNGYFLAEMMMEIFDNGNLALKDIICLNMTCKAFRTAISSELTRKAVWSRITETESFNTKARLIRSLGISEYEKKLFGRMEISELYEYCRHFSIANKWRFDDVTDTIVGILVERLIKNGEIKIPVSYNGTSPPTILDPWWVLHLLRKAYWLPSCSLIPFRFSITRAKMMYRLLGSRYTLKFIEPIPMWGGIVLCIASYFGSGPSLSSIPAINAAFLILFVFSTVSEFISCMIFLLD